MQENTAYNYQKMKEFLSFFSERFFHAEGLPPEHRPLAVLETLEKKGKKAASRGLSQAINDCIEMSRHMNFDAVKQLDSELRKCGTITLSELRKQYSKEYAKIVKLGRIKIETEYYLVRSMLDDTSVKMADTERELLEKMLFDYESITRVKINGKNHEA